MNVHKRQLLYAGAAPIIPPRSKDTGCLILLKPIVVLGLYFLVINEVAVRARINFPELFRLEKIRAERENEMFPDEMDTPMDQAARVRFQRFVRCRYYF